MATPSSRSVIPVYADHPLSPVQQQNTSLPGGNLGGPGTEILIFTTAFTSLVLLSVGLVLTFGVDSPMGEENQRLPRGTQPARILLISATHLVPDHMHRDKMTQRLPLTNTPYGTKLEFLFKLLYANHWLLIGGTSFDLVTNRRRSYDCMFGFSGRKCYVLIDHLGNDGHGGVLWKKGMKPPPIVQYRWDGKQIRRDRYIHQGVHHMLTWKYGFPGKRDDPWYSLTRFRRVSEAWGDKRNLMTVRFQTLHCVSSLCFPSWLTLLYILRFPGARHMEWLEEKLAEGGEEGQRVYGQLRKWLLALLRKHGGLVVWDLSF